jgi:hypothetical protein
MITIAELKNATRKKALMSLRGTILCGMKNQNNNRDRDIEFSIIEQETGSWAWSVYFPLKGATHTTYTSGHSTTIEEAYRSLEAVLAINT